uniref:Si:dkey-49n23.1 n=1 Tax=Tetraodon nigroviridis TaxID=99883 RepID=H3CH17_TETNG
MLLDEDGGWLLVGGKDHIYLLQPDSLEVAAATVSWPAPREHVERCRLAGKSPETDCANFVRLLQPFNKTHVYACGTGAFHPQCTYVHVSFNAQQEPSLVLSRVVESGRGKCPFSPREPFTAQLTGGELYSGTSVDFMGANSGIFRTSRLYIRTEAYDRHWLNEPTFVSSFSVPDTHSADDDKVYFFFKETAVEGEQWDRRRHSRVARVCKNDVGGRRSLINRWTTFLKARLLCSVPGPSGVDTHFDELEDIFVLETKDPQNPTIYGVFSTSSSVFAGSAVCVYSMASIRAAFNGPFAHKEGPEHRWVEFRGRVPYPRPGTCPSQTYDALLRSTLDFSDQLVSFVRQHQLMWEPVRPLGGRALLSRTRGQHAFRRLVVDRVDTEDRTYEVLHLGTDDGKVLKVVTGGTEDVLLEELDVFQSPSPVLRMALSTKRQQLYVSSELGVVQLGLQRCRFYGSSCAECCLARDPYCSWDGQTCSGFLTPNKSRARRQDVRYQDPWTQCPVTEDVSLFSQPLEVKVVYGVEGNSSFLECLGRWPQAELRWTFQRTEKQHQAQPLRGDEDHLVLMGRGLLLRHLQLAHSGVFTCTSHERSFSQALARYRLHVIASDALQPGHRLQQSQVLLGQAAVSPPLPAPRKSWLPPQLPARSLKHGLGTSQDVHEDCEQLWQREKRRQQKLRTLKQKQEIRRARVRRNN